MPTRSLVSQQRNLFDSEYCGFGEKSF